jgi:hypothetical protein
MARDLFKGKKGFLLLLVVCSEVGTDCQEKISVWGGPNIKRDMNI